jgi:poly-gamma-glutamate capsule biosynthesis protein CapA/YwtB (metallophosphatase superfamily)
MRRRLAAAGVFLLLSYGCGSRKPQPPTVTEPQRLTLVAVGDILMHGDVKKVALQNGGFEPLWTEVKPLFQSADLVFGNLETPVAPLIGKPGEPYIFNAPAELPQDLKRSGFTILSTANNHAYDQGVRGLLETQTRLQVEGLVSIGSGRDRARALAPRILERHGIRIAFLAWTDLFNFNHNQEKGPWVNKLDVAKACEAVRAARQQADAVVVSLHWGQEDHHRPTRRQRDIAAQLFEAGVDVILGHHPHVLQPLEVSEVDGRRVAVAYSLGNFISNQNRTYEAARMSLVQGDERDGAAVVATFIREPSGRVTLEKIGYTPLWTENNWREVNSGDARQRDIHVVRLDVPERQGQPWLQRRDRIRQVMGGNLENGAGW